MPNRGPLPRPTTLKIVEGVRADRVNRREPVPMGTDEPPEPPWELDGVARLTWNRLAPDLHRAGVLTAWDVDLFATYCELVAEQRKAHLALQAGQLKAGRSGELVLSPAWRAYRDITDRLRILAQEFGLTPSGRSRLVVLDDGSDQASREDEVS